MLSSIIFWGSSSPARSVSYTDSLFLVVSAMTLAGLNTVNLSILNTFQQFLLFVLIMLGSAILVSIVVVHTRRKAFEMRFKSVVEEEKQRRRDRSGSGKRLSFTRSVNRSGTEVNGLVNRGRTTTPKEYSSEAITETNIDSTQGLSSTDGQTSMKLDPQAEPEKPVDLEAGHVLPNSSKDGIDRSIDVALTRRITFASPSSPTRQREHGRILSMQGIGARPNLMNHPKQAERPIYASVLPRIDETRQSDTARKDGVLHSGFIGRNSQFSNLSLAERQRIGGVEYRAATVLAIVVPMYFIMWQLLGCIGLGAYVATKRSDVTTENGLNPWYEVVETKIIQR